jgi:hypothetical protein
MAVYNTTRFWFADTDACCEQHVQLLRHVDSVNTTCVRAYARLNIRNNEYDSTTSFRRPVFNSIELTEDHKILVDSEQ